MKTFAIDRILAATDLSDSSLPALRYARVFADRFSATLTVMYTDPVVYPLDYSVPAEAFFANTTPEHQDSLRKDVRAHADAVMEGRPWEIEVTVGQPVPAILASARDRNADLIVMGTHLRHGWRRALLGSVSEGVLHGTDKPVLTVAGQDRSPGSAGCEITNVLCPVNFSEVARDSLQVAAQLARAFGAHLTVVHVLEPDELRTPDIDEEDVRRWIGPELQGICTYRDLVLRGGPAERVLDCADDIGADFLVVGAQHKLFRDATVIGTTTERLLRFASAPVLVIPRQAVHAKRKTEEGVLTSASR